MVTGGGNGRAGDVRRRQPRSGRAAGTWTGGVWKGGEQLDGWRSAAWMGGDWRRQVLGRAAVSGLDGWQGKHGRRRLGKGHWCIFFVLTEQVPC
jgi:hypothetical protein